MKLLTFKGGIHPPYGKEYANKKPIEKAAANILAGKYDSST